MNHDNLRLRRAALCLACLSALNSPSLATAQIVAGDTPAAGDSTAVRPMRLDVPAFSTLFKDTVEDFGRLPSRDSLKWVGIGVAAAALAHPVDRRASRALSTAPMLDKVFEPGKTVGGARFQLAGALATYAIGRATRSSMTTRVGTDLLQAQLLSQALTTGIKMSVRRTRPDGQQYSFPSGHASVTFASATVLQRNLGWKVGLPAYGVATYVAASRIQEKRHFLSDVAFGAAIGIIAGRTVTVGRGNRRFAVAPAATAGGAGISFTWIGRD